MTRLRRAAALFAVSTTALAGCQTQKSSNPLSPSVAGPIPGVTITAPSLIEPAQGFKYKATDQPIRLVVQNATTSGVRPITYVFEVASDSAFQTKVFARGNVPPGPDGRTSVQIDALDLGRAYYWRARAEDGANIGLYSTAQFEVLPRPQLGPATLVSPVNNERVTSRRPTFTAINATRNAAVGSLHYEFHIAVDQAFTKMVAGGIVDEAAGQTSFTAGNDLPYDTTHYWRVKIFDGEGSESWSVTQIFRSPVTPPPGGGGGGGGGGGAPGSCVSNNGPAIAACIAAKYPEKLVAGVSLGERQANMGFIRDRMIEAGKCGGLDLGQNLKRGGPDLSIDFLVERRPQGDMGIDIGYDYDNTSVPLRVVWAEAGYGATYKPYPMPASCK